MNFVGLGPDGMLKHSGDKEVIDPLSCLGFGLTLSPNAQLRHFFKMLDNYPIFVRLSSFIPDLLSQYHQCPASYCCCDDFGVLEFSKTIEMVGFPGEPRVESYTSLKGKQEDRRLAVRDYPLSQIIDLQLCLGKLKHIVFGDKVDTFEFDTVITLFEFIDGIVWELSFQVLPKECQLRR